MKLSVSEMNPQIPMPGCGRRGRSLALLSQSTVGGGYSQPAVCTSSAEKMSQANGSQFESPEENTCQPGQGKEMQHY